MGAARRGFTLIEVLVALGILALGIGGAMAMFVAASATHRRALDDTAAAIIAETVIAEQRAAFNRSHSEDPVPLKRAAVPGYELYWVSVRPVVLARDPLLGRTVHMYLEVEVHFNQQGRDRSETYRTILFRE
ncbi:MAG: type IV pilus modification PilV family protein [Planctomycetota bacterium]|jgi:prepilin-type N-terminal cleavage/methylation domain-containing protein